MNQIERLKNDLERRFPGVVMELDPPADEQRGTWHLDIRRDGASPLVVEWRPDRGFGVSSIEDDVAYGEGPDEVYPNTKAACSRIERLMLSGGRTEPPRVVRLAELRQLRGLSQEELARRVGVGQANIARIEGRGADIRLTTLAKILSSMGATLAIEARFPDGTVKELELSNLVVR
jgi:DNA-binding Xre family transcriptional regulator